MQISIGLRKKMECKSQLNPQKLKRNSKIEVLWKGGRRARKTPERKTTSREMSDGIVMDAEKMQRRLGELSKSDEI